MAVSRREHAEPQQCAIETLKKVLADPQSCVKCVRKKLEIPLPPKHIGNEDNAIFDILSGWCYKFNNELQGVLLAFDNFEYADEYGNIKDDLPYVFWNIHADFYLFQPFVGAILKGTVARIGKIKSTVINCIVYEAVSAAVVVPEPAPPELAPYLQTGQEIFFRIEKISLGRSSVQGVVDGDCMELTMNGSLNEAAIPTEMDLDTF